MVAAVGLDPHDDLPVLEAMRRARIRAGTARATRRNVHGFTFAAFRVSAQAAHAAAVTFSFRTAIA